MADLLLDVHSLLFRSFHALPPMNTRGGLPTQALYGLSVLLLKLLREERPDGLAFARDLPGPTFRHRELSDYKGQRAPVPPALRTQLHELERLCEALDAPLLGAAGYEADDVLATLAGRLEAMDRDVLVVSGDRDLLQLVSPRVQVLFVGQRGRKPVRYDVAAFERRFGFEPSRLPSYVALIGDPADNLPKVKGVGPKTASALVASHSDVSAMLASAPGSQAPRIAALLARHAAQIRATEQLARLVRDVPMQEPWFPRPFDRAALERLADLFERWEFVSLIPRLRELAPA